MIYFAGAVDSHLIILRRIHAGNADDEIGTYKLSHNVYLYTAGKTANRRLSFWKITTGSRTKKLPVTRNTRRIFSYENLTVVSHSDRTISSSVASRMLRNMYKLQGKAHHSQRKLKTVSSRIKVCSTMKQFRESGKSDFPFATVSNHYRVIKAIALFYGKGDAEKLTVTCFCRPAW